MIKFEEVKRGYNKEQVDDYIKTINDEYKKSLADYQELEEELEKSKKDTSYSEAIAAALINAEISGKQIVANAQVEAKRTIIESEIAVGEIKEKKKAVLVEIDKLSKKLNEILDIHSDPDEKEKTDKETVDKEQKMKV
jgi:DivIVA protein.